MPGQLSESTKAPPCGTAAPATLIAAALAKAGVKTVANRLYMLAVDLLRLRKGDVHRAQKDMVARLRAEPVLLLALVEESGLLAALVEPYLDRVAADMRGAAGGRTLDVTQGDRHDIAAGSSSHAPGQPGAGDDQYKVDHLVQLGGVAAHNKPRTAGFAAVQQTMARALFDTLTIRDVPIGDLTFNQAKSFAHLSKREAAILDHVIAEIGVPSDANLPLRRLTRLSVIEQAVKKAEALS